MTSGVGDGFTGVEVLVISGAGIETGFTGSEVGSSVGVGEVVGVGCVASGWEGVHAAVTIRLANNNKIRRHI